MLRRRQFLTGGAALGAGVALDRLAGRPGAAATANARDTSVTGPGPATDRQRRFAFDGPRQAGVLTERQPYAIVVAFDAITASPAELAEGMRELSVRARALTTGYDALLGAPSDGPTPDSGVLGSKVTPGGLTVTIGVGASLFDGRYGLAARKPAGLKPMPVFPDDALVDAETHGDVLLQLCGDAADGLLHALRDLMRATRGVLAARWKVEGFLPPPSRSPGAGRNLLGFKDGTANPDTGDAGLMDRLVWDEAGGTYAVVRIIRNRVEFWDRVARAEQELMIGRLKDTGAPLGKAKELDDPDYAGDPKGARIPMDAHIRLARPRTAATEDQRILRRGYNYSRGIDEAGQLDMGLVFVAFNRDVERQFEVVQGRLAGEPLVDYVVPTGGGYFYLPPGARDAQDWVGSGLFT
ncbi:MAG TPA: Dyp-type peroxidase [Baekduia sp.]|uniref:Dyp-type peroxidase n=1 Tax=Baekduia sp. TaxID=2600305 RepID=UPI002BFEC403|nr:Dyp-type peroxidase [Baekduia sp.]HMJ34205.1 Dyp-type peroxidase [Baekduia sp.]